MNKYWKKQIGKRMFAIIDLPFGKGELSQCTVESVIVTGDATGSGVPVRRGNGLPATVDPTGVSHDKADMEAQAAHINETRRVNHENGGVKNPG